MIKCDSINNRAYAPIPVAGSVAMAYGANNYPYFHILFNPLYTYIKFIPVYLQNSHVTVFVTKLLPNALTDVRGIFCSSGSKLFSYTKVRNRLV